MKEVFIDCYNGYEEWEKTGLLTHLADEQKSQIIELFRELYEYRDDKYFRYYLPIIYRIYVDLLNDKRFSVQKFEEFTNPKSLLNKLYLLINVKNVVDKTNTAFEMLETPFEVFTGIDKESEICRLISIDYINIIVSKYNNNDIYKVIKELNRDSNIKKILD